jgi:glycolate oxidase FAD binding subunit
MEKLFSQLAGIVGSEHVITCPPEALPSSWKQGMFLSVSPGSVAEIQEVVTSVSTQNSAASIVPVGGGLQLTAGYPPDPRSATILLSLHRMNKITDHQPDDMTVTVEPGVTAAACDALLKGARQMLALDVPRPELATLGGTTAAAAHPLRRAKYGAVRDVLIGLHAVMESGEIIKGGGKVVKNVAGYDVCKLFAGSFGSAGILTDLTFRVQPLPEVRRTIVWKAGSAATAGHAALELHAARLAHTFLYVSGSTESGFDLCIGFDGIEKRVNWQQEQACNTALKAGIASDPTVASSDAELALQNAPADVLENCAAAARVSMLVTSVPSALNSLESTMPAYLAADVSSGLVQIAFRSISADTSLKVMKTVSGAGEDANIVWHHLEVDNLDLPRWGSQTSSLRLQRALKSAIDPGNLFSPGRFPGRA